MSKKIGICFSKEFIGDRPLAHIITKLPVYLRLLELCKKQDWDTYILTRKTYKGNGIFDGAWKFENGKFDRIEKPVKIDLVYDRTAGVKFPPADDGLIWVNRIDFKVFCWDKWKAYQKFGKYMPRTFLLEKEKDLAGIIKKIRTDKVVIKPYNGLKGLGIFIGPKEKFPEFKLDKKYKYYVVQEFVDTSHGLPDITKGMHDIRIVIINGKVVWSHVRVPRVGSFLSNAAQGGQLTEVDYRKVPESIKKVVDEIAKDFYSNYDNPVYSIDFGLEKNSTPKIFEFNDQIGFPKWEMKNRDVFLRELIANFSQKLNRKC